MLKMSVTCLQFCYMPAVIHRLLVSVYFLNPNYKTKLNPSESCLVRTPSLKKDIDKLERMGEEEL